MNLPAEYDFINKYNGYRIPSTVHVKDTALQRYFARYLLDRIVAGFDFELPETWDEGYFRYTLFILGYIGITKIDPYGVIPQDCGLTGYNIFYRPKKIKIANPYLPQVVERTIDVDCAVVKLKDNYTGVMDIVNHYADLMALTCEAVGVNLVNSKVAYMFIAQNKASAESYKKAFDQIQSGNPAVVVDKNLMNEAGEPSYNLFNSDIKSHYITTDLLNDLRTIELSFYNMVGIPNTDYGKRERMVVDEVNANNIETQCLYELWLDNLNRDIEKTVEMFPGLTFSVRKNYNMGGVINDNQSGEPLRLEQ